MPKCGNMTYKSYLLRKQGLCDDQQKGKENKMKLTLKNGLVVEGTLEQVMQVARNFGETVTVPAIVYYNDGVHYLSATHGLMNIADMSTQHIRNAIKKYLREYGAQIQSSEGLALLHVIRDMNSYATLSALILEYARRVDRGEK